MNREKTRAEWFSDYEDYREAYGYKKLYGSVIQIFVRWCERNYPDYPFFTQEMIDKWSPQRDTEKDWTYSGRAAAVNGFLRYINERGGGPFSLIDYKFVIESPEPILFTADQLHNFFKAVDEYQPSKQPVAGAQHCVQS